MDDPITMSKAYYLGLVTSYKFVPLHYWLSIMNLYAHTKIDSHILKNPEHVQAKY